MRLLDKSNLEVDMTKLGFEKHQIDTFKDAIYKPMAWSWSRGQRDLGKPRHCTQRSRSERTGDNISTAEDPVSLTGGSTNTNE